MSLRFALGVAAVTAMFFSTRFFGTPAVAAQGAVPAPSANACWNPSADIPLAGATCGPVQALQLSCYLPPDIVTAANLNTMQRSADIFSWQEFMALNWPALAGQRGAPDPGKKIGDPGARVWETWKEESEVFRPDGVAPEPWDALERIPTSCAGAAKHLFRTQKIDDVVDSALQAAAATGALPATLTDQHGKVVRYEIRMNRVMFDYIVQHRLYDAKVQTSAKTIAFPPGAMLVKAAWGGRARGGAVVSHGDRVRV